MTPPFFPRIVLLLKLWSCFLVFIYLPYELIFWIDSYRLSLSALDIIVNTAAMVLIMVMIAAMIALVGGSCSLLLSLPLQLLRKEQSPGTLPSLKAPGLTPCLLLFLSCYLFAKHFLFWAKMYNYEIQPIILGLLLAMIIAWRSRPNMTGKITSLVELLTRRLLVPVCVLALVLTGWRVTSELGRSGVKPGTLATREVNRFAKKPNIILVTFDALAAVDMPLYGYPLKTTPNIDAFAKECFVFDRAIASANWTRPTVASLLTGKYPLNHLMINSGLSANVNVYPDENLPAVLEGMDYRTFSLNANWDYAQSFVFGADEHDFVAYKNLDWLEFLPMFITLHCHNTANRTGIKSIFWLTEWLVGSDSYWYNKIKSLHSNIHTHTLPYFPPEYVFNRATGIVSNMNQKSSQPFFLWTHLMVPHSPYLPNPPFKGAFSNGSDEFTSFESQKIFSSQEYVPENQPNIDRLRLKYDENILYADNALGNYLSALKKSGRLDDSIVIISADHGESFSHGWQGHGGALLYQPLVHIPLLIHLPGQKSGQRIATTVSQTDVAPTILDLLGCPVPSWMNGRSLKDAFEGGQLADIPVFSMNLDGNPIRNKVLNGSVAVFYGDYKLLNSGEFFNLKEDPNESSNLLQQEPERAQRMSAMMRDMLARHK